jgi:hypothetical protein
VNGFDIQVFCLIASVSPVPALTYRPDRLRYVIVRAKFQQENFVGNIGISASLILTLRGYRARIEQLQQQIDFYKQRYKQ